jgi:hypothetical protein
MTAHTPDSLQVTKQAPLRDTKTPSLTATVANVDQSGMVVDAAYAHHAVHCPNLTP